MIIELDSKKLDWRFENHLPEDCDSCPFNDVETDEYMENVYINCRFQHTSCYTYNRTDETYVDDNDNPIKDVGRPKECPLIRIEEEA